jgi:hypothetical protein
MKSLEYTKTIVSQFKVQPGPEMRSKVLDEALKIQRDRQSNSDSHIWRIIMKSPITKIAAVVIIIAVTLFLQNGSVDVATPAFGLDDITAAMQKAEWIHVTITVEELRGSTETSPINAGEKMESWESIKPHITVSKLSDGKIEFCEPKVKRTYRYDPETNAITVKYKNPSDTQKTYTSISDKFFNLFREIEDRFENTKYEEDFYKGQRVTIIYVDKVFPEVDIHYTASFIFHPETFLPMELNIQQTFLYLNAVSKTNWVFDYPENGPKDIYEAGAPRDAKIIEEIQDENK